RPGGRTGGLGRRQQGHRLVDLLAGVLQGERGERLALVPEVPGDHGDAEVLVDEVEEAVHIVDLQRDGPPYAGGGEGRVGGAARPPVRVEVDEDLAAEVVRGQRRSRPRQA